MATGKFYCNPNPANYITGISPMGEQEMPSGVLNVWPEGYYGWDFVRWAPYYGTERNAVASLTALLPQVVPSDTTPETGDSSDDEGGGGGEGSGVTLAIQSKYIVSGSNVFYEDWYYADDEAGVSLTVKFREYMTAEVIFRTAGRTWKGSAYVDDEGAEGGGPTQVDLNLVNESESLSAARSRAALRASDDSVPYQVTVALRATFVTQSRDSVLKFYAMYRSTVKASVVTFSWYAQEGGAAVLKTRKLTASVRGTLQFLLASDIPPMYELAGTVGKMMPALPREQELDGMQVVYLGQPRVYLWQNIYAKKMQGSESYVYGYFPVSGMYDGCKVGGERAPLVFGYPYPRLEDCNPGFSIPDRPGRRFLGIWLVVNHVRFLKCYNSQGEPIARVSWTFGVSIGDDGVIDSSADPRMVAVWSAPEEGFDDVAAARKALGVIPEPFASAERATASIPKEYEPDGLSYKYGFGESFSVAPEPGGGAESGNASMVMTRRMANSIGNLGTQLQFFEQCGGYHTFDLGFAEAVGGYPKGALLQFYQPSTNALRTVRSLKDGNMTDFTAVGVDGVDWEYADDSPEAGIDVDYSSCEDIGEALFVEHGVPDLYEVQYDSYLQLFALGTLDPETLMRDTFEDVDVLVGYKEGTVFPTPSQFTQYENPETSPNNKDNQIHRQTNGMFWCYGQGTSFLDIYHSNSSDFNSVIIGGFEPFEAVFTIPRENRANFLKLNSCSPFSAGVFLSAGDKIRIRNIVLERVSGTRIVHPRLFTDEELGRRYFVRSGLLYKTGVRI